MSVVLAVYAHPANAEHLENSVAGIFDDGQGSTLPYHVLIPPGHDEQDASFPLVLYLHGASRRGDDNLSQLDRIEPLIDAVQDSHFASVLLAPQAPLETNWWNHSEITGKLVDDIIDRFSVDPDRVYVVGRSNGAFGAYGLLIERPTLFAAAISIAGGWAVEDAPMIQHVPVWMFHGEDDEVVPVRWSRDLNAALVAEGGSPRYTELPGAGHDIAPSVYEQAAEELYPWLYSQNRDPTVPIRRLPDNVYASRDRDLDGDGDRVANPTLRWNLGEIDTATRNELNRLIVKFELPDVGRDLREAKLRLFLEETDRAPPGPVSLFHSITDNDLENDVDDYQDASYTDTRLDVVQPTEGGEMYYELDVTEWVRADYSNDMSSPLSAFRLQVSEASFLDDDVSNNYRFTMLGGTTNRPELSVQFISETPGVIGDLNLNGVLDLEDVNILISGMASGSDDASLDLNEDLIVDRTDLKFWVNDLRNTWIGDANLDHEFNELDLVAVLEKGKYLVADRAGWDEGNWNGDLRFTEADVVAAFIDGGYLLGPRGDIQAVPEPSTAVIVAIGFLLGFRSGRRGHGRAGEAT